MPRVDFYILPEAGTRERFTCEIAGKIYRQQLGLHIHTCSREEARILDDFLWTYKDISFLPHCLIDDVDDTSSITIGWEGTAENSREVLINLSTHVPGFVTSFDRVVEIVPPDDPGKQQARDRYRQYQEAGYELHKHDLNSASAPT